MVLKEITEEYKDQYQKHITEHGAFLQDWEWGEFQEYAGKKVYRYGIFEGDELLFSAQIINNYSSGFQYFFAPYGPVIKPGQDNIEELYALFGKKLKEIFPKLLFIRYEPQHQIEVKKPLVETVNLNPHKTLILTLKGKTPEQIYEGMHQKTRYNIRVAEKNGVRIELGNRMEEAAKIFTETSERSGVRFSDNSYIAKFADFFSSKDKRITTKFYTAWHENDMIAVTIMIYYRKTMYYLFAGSTDHKRNVMGSYAIQWQMIKDAINEGYAYYDFWGVEEDPNHPWYGFSRFKLRFGGDVVRYTGTLDYILKPTWYNIYVFVRKLNRLIRK